MRPAVTCAALGEIIALGLSDGSLALFRGGCERLRLRPAGTSSCVPLTCLSLLLDRVVFAVGRTVFCYSVRCGADNAGCANGGSASGINDGGADDTAAANGAPNAPDAVQCTLLCKHALKHPITFCRTFLLYEEMFALV